MALLTALLQCQYALEVLIPAYNAQQTLARAIASVPADLPILLLDDGSTDSTFDLAFLELHNRDNARILRQPNKGTLSARCRLILASSADWIVFLDADDELNASALVDLDLARFSGVDIVFANQFDDLGVIRATSAGQRFTSRSCGVSMLYALFAAPQTHFFSFAGKIVRRSAFEDVAARYLDFGPRVLVSEDLLMMAAALINGACVLGVDVNLYRVHDSLFSVTKRDASRSYDKCAGDYKARAEVLRLARNAGIERLVAPMIWWIQIPDQELPCKQLAELLRLFPGSLAEQQLPKATRSLFDSMENEIARCWVLGELFDVSTTNTESENGPEQCGTVVIEFQTEEETDEFQELFQHAIKRETKVAGCVQRIFTADSQCSTKQCIKTSPRAQFLEKLLEISHNCSDAVLTGSLSSAHVLASVFFQFLGVEHSTI